MAQTRLLERPARIQVGEAEHRPGSSAGRQAFLLLQAGFAAAPVLAGLDKFLNLMTSWERYLAPTVERLLPVSGSTFMLAVGVVEILAGLLVAIVPRIGAFLVAGWLGGIIVNLLLIPGYYDVALRDIGLLLGAVALGLLARDHGRPLFTLPKSRAGARA